MWGGIFQSQFQSQRGTASSEELWRENINPGGWATHTILVLFFILVCQLASKARFWFQFRAINDHPSLKNSIAVAPHVTPPIRISAIISDLDLKSLIDNLDEKHQDNEKWDNVIDRSNSNLSYHAKCCKTKDGPPKYLSVTVFENCSVEMLRDFYMDSDYRKKWDKTLLEHEQLQADESTGTEIGRMIKKFPLLTPREYIVAWKLWEGRDGTLYCFSKECEHSSAPRRKKYVRVRFFRSGWRIRKVPGGNASEIKMVHQEDAGLNVEMARLAFARGIWSYVCKMDNALRRYSVAGQIQPSSAVTAVTLIQKVPAELDSVDNTTMTTPQGTDAAKASCSEISQSGNGKKISGPSKKMIANGLILVGGVICLSSCHSGLGAKAVMAYVLSKFTKRGGSSQSKQS